MDAVSATANTRAALNAGDVQQAGAVNALKIAAQSEEAIVQVVEEAARAAPPEGQGNVVDKLA
jgi:hypothetical protein